LYVVLVIYITDVTAECLPVHMNVLSCQMYFHVLTSLIEISLK